jgi:hypothetical protein
LLAENINFRPEYQLHWGLQRIHKADVDTVQWGAAIWHQKYKMFLLSEYYGHDSSDIGTDSNTAVGILVLLLLRLTAVTLVTVAIEQFAFKTNKLHGP